MRKLLIVWLASVDYSRGYCSLCYSTAWGKNCIHIPELHNAAPDLIAVVRAAKEVDAAAAIIRVARFAKAKNQGPLLRNLENALDALRKALAELEKR